MYYLLYNEVTNNFIVVTEQEYKSDYVSLVVIKQSEIETDLIELSHRIKVA